MAPTRASYVFIGLNVVRALSIIALVLLFASSITTLVQDVNAVNTYIAEGKPKGNSTLANSTQAACAQIDPEYVPGSTVPNQPAGAFWAVLNRLLIIFQVIVLILSEVRWPAAFFNRFFPVLGDEFGLGALGIMQGLLGASVLSHHVDEFSLVSAFFLFALACLNMLLGLIFRESAKSRRSIRAWRERNSNGGMTDLQGPPQFVRDTQMGGSGDWADAEKGGADAVRSDTIMTARSGKGFGRQGEKAALARGETVTRPMEALPTYAPRPAATPITAPSFPVPSPRPMTESDVTAA